MTGGGGGGGLGGPLCSLLIVLVGIVTGSVAGKDHGDDGEYTIPDPPVVDQYRGNTENERFQAINSSLI